MCGVRPKFWEGGWIEMEKSKRTFRGSYPAYALTYFFFYWSLGVFTSVLSMYLTGIGKSKVCREAHGLRGLRHRMVSLGGTWRVCLG